MARYIDADAEIKKLTERHCKQDCIENHKCLICLVNDIQQYLDLTAETADVKPVVHAHWERIWIKYAQGYYCTNCNAQIAPAYREYAYCPHCGAKMDEEMEE